MPIAFPLFLLLVQVPQAPASTSQGQSATASIEGTVRRLGTGEPVYKARLVLNGGASGTPSPAGPKSSITDKDGHFSFTGLDAGRYNLQVYANGYVRQSYGQKAFNQPGRPIVLAANQQFKDVLFEITPTGTITGRIFDFDNVPLPDADVVLEKFSYDINGERNMQVVQQARTNDLGEYRLFWITPGKYYLRAEFTGTVIPLMHNPNQYVGPPETGIAPMYYPSATDVTSASEIEILPGMEQSTIDLALVRTRSYTVRGRVIVSASNTGPGSPFVSIRPQHEAGAFRNVSASAKPDGTFELRNVLAGAYILQANTSGNPISALRNEIPLNVNGDMDSVVITLSPGFDLPFHIVSDDASPAITPDVMTKMQPLLRSLANGPNGSIINLLNRTNVKPDGTFTISNVLPGSYGLQLSPLPSSDHYIKAIMLGQTDALRDGITVDHTPDAAITVVIGSHAGKIDGTVVDNDGKPVQAAQVTLIPIERIAADRVRVAVTNTRGQFSFSGIFPTGYRLFAWETIEPNAYRDPEFVRRYEQQSKPVTIVEGSNPDVELHVIKVNP